MAAEFMKKLPFTRFAMEMRSGKIIEIDDGFVKMLGYTEEDMKNGVANTVHHSFSTLIEGCPYYSEHKMFISYIYRWFLISFKLDYSRIHVWSWHKTACRNIKHDSGSGIVLYRQ